MEENSRPVTKLKYLYLVKYYESFFPRKYVVRGTYYAIAFLASNKVFLVCATLICRPYRDYKI